MIADAYAPSEVAERVRDLCRQFKLPNRYHTIDSLILGGRVRVQLGGLCKTELSLSQKSELVMGMSLGVPSKRHQLGRC